MKVVLAGAYGKLGVEILKELVKQGHEVVAADMVEKEVQDLDTSKVTLKKINVTDKATLDGLCEGAKVVISTVDLTTSSATISNYDIDYKGNLNILEEAKNPMSNILFIFQLLERMKRKMFQWFMLNSYSKKN